MIFISEVLQASITILAKKIPAEDCEQKMTESFPESKPGTALPEKRFPETDAVQVSLYSDDDYISKDSIHICPAEHVEYINII